MKILIADDNRDNLYYLSSLLQGEGHEVLSAENGLEALDWLSKGSFELIISDILMPKMDGFQLCRECKKDSALRDIPFIFYTATYMDRADREFGLSIGADEYIIKPMEPDELLGVIDRVIGSKGGKDHTAAASAPEDESDYLTEHNKRLIQKLESKMMQLEEKQRELEKEIVERRQAEERIKESEERFKTIFDTVNDAIFIQEIDTGTILGMNQATCNMFGYDRTEMCALSIEKLSAGDHPVYTSEEMQRLVIKAINGESQLFEWIVRDKKGRCFWVEIHMKLVHIGAADRILVVARDIQARKSVEEALNDERLKLQTLSENAPFGMLLIDDAGHFVYVNTKFREMFGYDPAEIPDGREWFIKAYPDDQYRKKAILTWLENTRDAGPGEKRPIVFNVACKDGSQKTINFIPLKLASGQHLVTCEDITDFKKLESQLRQSQKMEAIGNLAGGIAHDFNNILTTLMGYAGLLQMEIDKHSHLGLYVDQIISASQKAANLTRSLLTFSRQQPVVLNPLDVNDTIKASEKLLKRLLTEDVELRVSLGPDDMVIMADPTQIDQILFNLVANARDAMSKGGVVVIETAVADIDEEFINAYGFGTPGKYAQIVVSDTGIGMDESTKEKIFEPFFSTKEVGRGTGLGLSTVYGIVKQHKGHITVYSEPGKGSTFRIYLPVIRVKTDREQEAAPAVQGGKETVLIAEDNAEVRRLIREVLKTYGYRIIEAVNGEDAVEKFKDHEEIDIMIVDSVMPKKNGREVYEEAKKIRPDIKVFFISGHTKDIVLNKGIADLELDFLPKPLSPTQLLLKVREVLDRDVRVKTRE